MRLRYVYLVWLRYEGKHDVLSAVFASRDEAERYAVVDTDKSGYECIVTAERVYTSSTDV